MTSRTGRRAGYTYPIDDEWRARVVARLEEIGWSQARLAREAGMKSRSLLSELLSGEKDHTTYLPEIHVLLKWPPPKSSSLPEFGAGEMTYIWGRLDEVGRRRVIESARYELDRVLEVVREKKLRRT